MRGTKPSHWLVCCALLTVALCATPLVAHAASGWLGVATQQLTSDLRDGLDYRGDGVLVTSVVDGSPADRAGLRKGDILVAFNSRSLGSPDELRQMVSDAGSGRTVALTVVRDGGRRTLSAKLSSRSQDSMTWQQAPAPPRAMRAPDAPEAPEAPRGPRMTWKSKDGGDEDLRIWKDDSDGQVRIWKDGKELDPDQMRDHMKEMMGDLRIERDDDGSDDDSGQRLRKRIVMRAPLAGAMGRGRLGVRIESLNPDLASALGAGGQQGALVLEVMGGTAAEKAGIKAGDIIVSVGRTSVSDADGLVKALEGEDGQVSIGVVRRGVKRSIEATLEDAPRVMRFKSGDGQMGLGRLKEISPPRIRIERDTDRDGLREELDQLRSELRDLRRQLEDSKR